MKTLIERVKSNCPVEMLNTQAWLGLRNVYQDGKWRKPPVDVSGYFCDARDNINRVKFEDVAKAILNGKSEGFTYYLQAQNICVLRTRLSFVEGTSVWTNLLKDTYTETIENSDELRIFFKTETPQRGKNFKDKNMIITTWHEVTGNIFDGTNHELRMMTDWDFNYLCEFFKGNLPF